jgi:Ca2+-binding EF-hand superfamily protein
MQYTSSYEQARVPFGGITDIEGARAVARRLFEQYDKDRNGLLDTIEVAPMMVDAYRAMNKGFNPSRADVDTYSRILDRNNDGRVTLQDIEDIAVRYLVGEGSTTVRRTEVVKKAAYAPEVEQRLDVARRLFKQFDKSGDGFLNENEVPGLIAESYKAMGINSYVPSREDVNQWMNMTDKNRDGRVSLAEYEELVIRSLKNAGII